MGDRTSRGLAATLTALALTAACAPIAGAVPPPVGGLTQTQCISEIAGGGCTAGDGVADARHVAVSPDAKNVYVASAAGGGSDQGALAAFTRNPGTGTLTELNCVGETAGNGCATAGDGLSQASGVSVSPDGQTIYVTSSDFGGGAVAAFARNQTTGAIGAELGCISENATGTCLDGHGLTNTQDVAATNQAVYVAAADPTTGGLTSFARGAGGALGAETACFNQLGMDGCTTDSVVRNVNAVVIASDGHVAYATGEGGITTTFIVSYRIDQNGALSARSGCVVDQPAASGGCRPGNQGFSDATDLAVAPDHRVYVAGIDGGSDGAASPDPGGISALAVDANTLALTGAINCVEAGGAGCAPPFVPDLRDANGIELSPDGQFVYAASQRGGGNDDGAVLTFTRDAATGAIGALVNCVGETGSATCAAGDGISTASFLAVSPDGRNVYLGDADGGQGGGVTTFTREFAPTCDNATATVPAGLSVTLPLTCRDPNGDPIARTIVSGPTFGVLDPIDQVNGTVSYTASTLASGADAITFSASDGSSTSPDATVAITVTPAPDVPLGKDQEPDSNIDKIRSRISAKSLKKFTGTATDDIGVDHVDIALVHASGGAHAATARAAAVKRVTSKKKTTKKKRKPKPACRQMTSKGTFLAFKAKNKRCSPTHWIPVTGTTTWSFKLPKRLPKGTYTLYSRATDDADLTETSFTGRDHNRVSFTVR